VVATPRANGLDALGWTTLGSWNGSTRRVLTRGDPPVTVDNHEQVGKSVGRFVGESVTESLKPFIPLLAAANNRSLARTDTDEGALVVED
jgi:hypothetical protein